MFAKHHFIRYELKTIKNIDAQFTTSENEKGKLSKIMTVTIFGKMTVITSRHNNDDQPYKEFNGFVLTIEQESTLKIKSNARHLAMSSRVRLGLQYIFINFNGLY